MLESVTVARHKGKKKQQVARSSSPVAGPSGQFGRSPSSAGSFPPGSPLLDSSIQPVPAVLSRNAILKEGWNLLKSYFDNSATADDVYNFLQNVKEPELEEAFAEITGCEPDDHTRQVDLVSKLNSKLEELEKLAATPKQLGIFSSFLFELTLKYLLILLSYWQTQA